MKGGTPPSRVTFAFPSDVPGQIGELVSVFRLTTLNGSATAILHFPRESLTRTNKKWFPCPRPSTLMFPTQLTSSPEITGRGMPLPCETLSLSKKYSAATILEDLVLRSTVVVSMTKKRFENSWLHFPSASFTRTFNQWYPGARSVAGTVKLSSRLSP